MWRSQIIEDLTISGVSFIIPDNGSLHEHKFSAIHAEIGLVLSDQFSKYRSSKKGHFLSLCLCCYIDDPLLLDTCIRLAYSTSGSPNLYWYPLISLEKVGSNLAYIYKINFSVRKWAFRPSLSYYLRATKNLSWRRKRSIYYRLFSIYQIMSRLKNITGRNQWKHKCSLLSF